MHRASHRWQSQTFREYLEVSAVIGAATLLAWFVPLDYRVFGDVYLLAVIALCLRVGRWPIFFAAILSVLAWNFVIVPPRLSFSRLDLKDGVFLGFYFVAALLAGQLTARIRAQERRERQSKQRATALFDLTRALSAAQCLDEAVTAALRQADQLFAGQSSLLLLDKAGDPFISHPASSLALTPSEIAELQDLRSPQSPGLTSKPTNETSATLHVPLVRGGTTLGVFSVQTVASFGKAAVEQRELLETFAAQIGLLVERERLRAASEREKLLTESDRLYRTLLDSVSHELKTPVAVLRSAGENLSADHDDRRRALGIEILTASDRLHHLISNLLSQSRLDAGGLKTQMDWCDARDIVGAVRKAVGDAISGRPLLIEIPADMPLFMADFVLMEQVISNLVLNAVLHTPALTPIKISAGTDPQLNRVHISVSDRGPGVSPELRETLFEKFRRGAPARAGGLGLGLSIVKGFMLAQGGDVSVISEPSSGASFTVHLPYHPHENVPQE